MWRILSHVPFVNSMEAVKKRSSLKSLPAPAETTQQIETSPTPTDIQPLASEHPAPVVLGLTVPDTTLASPEVQNTTAPQPSPDASLPIDVIISHENHPYNKLSMESMRKIMDCLLFKISNSLEDESPKFEQAKMSHQESCIQIRCINDFSKAWLERVLPECSSILKLNTPIRLIMLQQVLTRVCLTSSIILDSQEILTLLQKQNALKTDGWRLIATYSVPTAPDSCDIHLLVEIDEASKECLERRDFKAFVGFSQVKFSIPDKAENEKVIQEFRSQKRRILLSAPIRTATTHYL